MNPDTQSAIFAAIYKALQSEGLDKNDAYRVADRGAKLLTEPDKPVPAHAHASDESSSTAFPHSAAAGLNSSPGDLVRSIDSLRLMLMDRINVICCVLGSIAMSVFLGLIFITILLVKIKDRLAVE